MASKLVEDPRIDPRIKAVFGGLDFLAATGDVASREDMLAAANSESTALTMKPSHRLQG
jgi:hypothetical protein